MSWIAPTADDVLGEFTPDELASITSLLGGEPLDNTTLLANILSRTVAEIRDYIRSGDYAVSTDPTLIPEGLINDAISISRWRFLVSVPAFRQLQTEERKKLYDDSVAKLGMIATAKFSVEPPEAETNPPGTVNWNSENKLLMRTHPVPRPGIQFTPPANTYANPDGPDDTPNDT